MWKQLKYTYLVRLFSFLITSVIHEFQYCGILETSPYCRVFAFFALWFWWNYKTLIIHVPRYVLFCYLYRVLCIYFRVFFLCNNLKNTQNIFFGNVILFLHIGWFASVLAFFYVNLLKDTFSVILFWISI